MLQEIALYLQSLSLGALGTDLFISLMPDEPDNAACLYQYAGKEYDYTLDGEREADKPGLQVVVRGVTHALAEARMNSLFQILSGLHNTSLSDVQYYSILAIASPFTLGIDARQRHKLAVNFAVTRLDA